MAFLHMPPTLRRAPRALMRMTGLRRGAIVLAVTAALGAGAVTVFASHQPSTTVRTDAAAASHGTAASQAPATAQMVCSNEIRRDVAAALTLPTLPQTTATWSDDVYTCTYHLAGGPLVFSVRQLPSAAAGQQSFSQLRRQIGADQPVVGLASFGLPGYESPRGVVVFRKGDFTLDVDASALLTDDVPAHETRTAFAFELASDVLGCWTGD